MKLRLYAIPVLSLVGLAVSQPAAARPWRVNQVPNGTVATCLTCHVFPGGPRNAFGTTIETYGGRGFLLNGDVQWGTVAIAETPGATPKTLAEIDSDGDGRTNGEELLDPSGSWRANQPNPGNPALVRSPAKLDAAVVMRQLFVAGGLPGALFNADFVELYNRSNETIAIGGWSIQYAPPIGSGNWGSSASAITVLPGPLTLQPGQSYLVQEASGGVAGAPLAQRDLVGEIAFGDTGGKVVLVNDSIPLGCNGSPTTCTPAALGKIVDLVGYGNATYFEGLAAAHIPPSDSALSRARSGCTDIDNNGIHASFPDVPADFALAQATPRSSTSAPAACGSVVATVAASPFGWLLILGVSLAVVGARAHRTIRICRCNAATT